MTEQQEQRLNEVLADYLQAIDIGSTPDRQALLDAHPDLAGELRSFFANQEQLVYLAGSMLSTTSANGRPTELEGRRSFGDYELLEEIGRGGMGVVYKARQVSLKRTVALKMILAGELATRADVERFHAEARAAAHLQHPNIVPIHEVGEFQADRRDGDDVIRHSPPPIHYFSMKLIEGGSLVSWIRHHIAAEGTEKPPQRGAVQILVKVARAVHFAHQHGIVHRDLKPANILLEGDMLDPVPYVSDFGLAKRLTGDPEASTAVTNVTAGIVGTASYMAPEQAAPAASTGEGRRVSTAADIYSLGAILYESLTGRPPFRGASPVETLILARDTDPVRPRALNRRVDRDLETICLKCLHKEASSRYGSADALADDLERWRAGEPILARPASAPERAAKWARRRPTVAALLAGIVVLGIAAFGVVTWQWRQTTGALHDKERALRQAEANFAGKMIALAQQHWLSARLDEAKQLLADVPEPYRNDEWRALNAACDAERATIPTRFTGRLTLTWSPNGRMVALVNWGLPVRAVQFWDIHNCQRISERHLEESLGAVAFSASGEEVVFASALRAQLILPSNSERRATPKPVPRIIVWDATRGQLIQETPVAGAGQLLLSPDGKALRLVVDANGAHLWDAVAGTPLGTLADAGSSVPRPTLSARGRLLAAHSAGTVRVWDTATGRLLHSLPTNNEYFFGLIFGHDSRRLAWFEGMAPGPRRITVRSLEPAGTAVSWQEEAGGVNAIALSPNGRLLAAGNEDKTVSLFDAATGRELVRLRGHRRAVTTVTFNPDGRQLASASTDGVIRIWDVGAWD